MVWHGVVGYIAIWFAWECLGIVWFSMLRLCILWHALNGNAMAWYGWVRYAIVCLGVVNRV